MKGGKGDTKDDRSYGECTKDLPDSLESKPFRNGRGEFDKERDHVKHKVPGNKKEHGADTKFVSNDRINNVPPPTQIKQDGAGIKHIRKETILPGGKDYFREREIARIKVDP